MSTSGSLLLLGGSVTVYILLALSVDLVITSKCGVTKGACSVSDVNLDCWREDIDVYTDTILDAVNQRAIVANHIGQWKKQRGLPIFDPTRAKAVIDRIVARNPGPFPDEDIRIIFETIVNVTTKFEEEFVGSTGRYRCPCSEQTRKQRKLKCKRRNRNSLK